MPLLFFLVPFNGCFPHIAVIRHKSQNYGSLTGAKRRWLSGDGNPLNHTVIVSKNFIVNFGIVDSFASFIHRMTN